MVRFTDFLLFFFLFCLSAGASTDVIIPKTQKYVAGKGTFVLRHTSTYASDTPLSKNALNYLQKHLKKNAGYILQNTEHIKQSSLYFHYNPKKIKKQEAYTLSVKPHQITIEARDKAGFFYGVVSLLQLMDTAIWREEGKGKKHLTWAVPACNIEDYPRFKWRGLMLDCSRNFFSVGYVKKFIDRMAQHKLNRFHWHLTDDEGWRIEIKHYPLLTKVGAKRGPGTKLPFSTYPAMRGPKNRVQQGYYTQKQIKEIVAYAKARSVEIIPEIDVPGHAKAALVSYPKLLQDPDDKSAYRSVQKIANNTMNPAMESTYVFLDNVIKEVSYLFPFPAIHVGGDEVPKGAWKYSPLVKALMSKKSLTNRREVEDYFFRRLDRILARHHREMIAWQEVATGRAKVRSSSTFMAWKSTKAGLKLAKRGRNVVMAPVQYLYFDQQYTRAKGEPGHTWSTPVSTEKTYSFKPADYAKVKGVEACLWSERLLNEKIADYLAWPRVLALSEVAWTDQKKRAWKAFRKRASGEGLKRLKAQGIHYRRVNPVR